MAFLAGGWRQVDDDTRVDEHWSPPRGEVMLGTSQTTVKGRTVFFEFMQLEAQADGAILFRAWPRGGGPGAFKMTASSEGRSATFENPAHDYPQRITYTLEDDGTLTAEIWGTVDGKERSARWKYVRVD